MRRMSLAILMRERETTLSAPETSAKQSVVFVVSIRLSAVLKEKPVSRERISGKRRMYSGSALSPVPTAVPPMLSASREEREREMRRIPRRTATAYESISSPRVIGTASWRCVRPILMTSLNASPFSSKPLAMEESASIRRYAFLTRQTLIEVGKTSFVDCAMFAWLFGEMMS